MEPEVHSIGEIIGKHVIGDDHWIEGPQSLDSSIINDGDWWYLDDDSRLTGCSVGAHSRPTRLVPLR